jgi:hypothetical protein
MIILNAVVLSAYFAVKGKIAGPGPWLLVLIFVLIILPTVYYIIRAFRADKINPGT